MQFKAFTPAYFCDRLPNINRQIILGMLRVLVTDQGKELGFMVPISDIKQAELDGAIASSKTIPLRHFRTWLLKSYEHLDCLYITVHTRTVLAFLSPSLSRYVPIPKLDSLPVEAASKIIMIDAGMLKCEEFENN